jgi:hypothetical protein
VKKRVSHLAAILERGRIYRRVPAAVRARVLVVSNGLGRVRQRIEEAATCGRETRRAFAARVP